MKIRSGFVSNSSSSSFLIYGIRINSPNVLKDKLNFTEEELESINENQYNIIEILYEKDLGGIHYYNAYDGEVHFIGRSWDDIADDETGLEFKESIEKSVKALLGEDAKCSTHQEAWFD